jgi:predicted ATPase
VIDEKGQLSVWPEGFFDQYEKDLAQLTGWN